jgi:hypothetical protein
VSDFGRQLLEALGVDPEGVLAIELRDSVDDRRPIALITTRVVLNEDQGRKVVELVAAYTLQPREDDGGGLAPKAKGTAAGVVAPGFLHRSPSP